MQAVVGPPCIRALLAKKASLGPRSRLQVGAQGVLPAGAEHSTDWPRLESSLLYSKHDGRAVWRLAGCSLGVWEPSLGAGTQWPLPLQNDLPARASQPGVTISPQTAGDAIFLGGRRAAPESGFPGLCRAASVSLLRYQTSGPAPRALIPESGPCVCLHSASLANTFLGQSNLPMGKEAAGMRLRGPGAMTGTPS